MLTHRTIDKDQKNQRKIVIEALILTLLIHALLLFLFVYNPGEKLYSNVKSAGITFMNMNNQSPEKREQLMNWLEYHDPSLISAPNTKYGYSKINAPVKFREARPDRKYKVDFPKSPKGSLTEFEDLSSLPIPETSRSQNFIMQPLGHNPDILKKPDPVKVSTPEIKYPLVKCNGNVLNLSLPDTLIERAKKFNARPTSIHFQWTPNQMLPRTELIQSSGDRNFDMSVIAELLLQADNIPHEAGDLQIRIEWQKGGAK
jgi:hypothetical protein